MAKQLLLSFEDGQTSLCELTWEAAGPRNRSHGALDSVEFRYDVSVGDASVPPREPISWREAVHNQFAVVPGQAARRFEKYLLRRGQFMRHIEEEDMKQLKSQPSH